MKDPAIRGILGREAQRLRDVSVLWDDMGGQVLRVYDDATPQDDPDAWSGGTCEQDQFELTEAGLAYAARFEKRRA
jgi:hypothetical protein